MARGLIHLYTGDGKGKTTAALGLILRARGRGMRTVLVQLLKGSDTGELAPLRQLGVTILRNDRDFGFYHTATEVDKSEMYRQNTANLAEAVRLAEACLCDLLVLDEICAAYSLGAVDVSLADKLIQHKPQGLELVLTGRDAPEHFTEVADYVTDFVSRRHPYDRGIAAREGIEY
jgi:cob(I)alamin adenosyltransferase